MVTTNTGKFYREVEDYINNDVAKYACEISNIESVSSARQGDHIFMELVHEDSAVRYFDCTSLDKSNIGIMVGYIMANIPIRREIQDREAKKAVRKIFRQEKAYD